MSYRTIKSELVARKNGKIHPVFLSYEIRTFSVDEEAGAVKDTYDEWLAPGQKVPPDGEYMRQPHLLQAAAAQVHITGGRMKPGWGMAQSQGK
jgi:hypothetical protein